MEIIHIVLGKANPNRLNGVNVVVYNLATEQARTGHEVSVWGIAKDCSENFGKRNFETRIYPASQHPFHFDESLKKDILDKKGKAIFHFHGGWIPVFYGISRFLTSNNIAYIATPHGAYNEVAMQKKYWLKKVYFQIFEKQYLDGASGIHALGYSELTGLNAFYKNDKSRIIPYGYTVHSYPKSCLINKDEFIIGYLGRLDVQAKGLDLLINAFELFAHKHPEAKLWLVGDGEDKSVLVDWVKEKGLTHSVVFWGSKFGREKEELLENMHIFAHPSRCEGLPTAVLEAASFGLPCVVSVATNLREYIEAHQSGIVIRNDQATDLLHAFESMHRHWSRNELRFISASAISMVENSFNWSKILEKFDKMYHSAMKVSEKILAETFE